MGSTVPVSAATDIPDAPIPDDAGSRTYATMGTDSDNPTATVYGNFKCPYTQKFVREGNLEAVLNEYVKSGDLNVRFRTLAYQPPGTSSHGTSTYYISDSDPLISEAAMGVWDVSPDEYWEFFNYMFSDLISGNVSLSEMKGRMKSTGVDDRGTIIDRASSDEYSDDVEENRYTAGDYDVSFTPTLVLDGDTIAPHHDVDDLLSWIGDRISSSADTSEDEGTDSSETSDEGENSSDSLDTADSSDSSDSEGASDTTDSADSSGSSESEDSSDTSDSEGSSDTADSGVSSSSTESDDSTDSSDTESDDTDDTAEQSSDDSESGTDGSEMESTALNRLCRMILTSD